MNGTAAGSALALGGAVGDDGEMLTDHRAPPAEVLAAFGLSGSPQPLPGGQGDAWRVRDRMQDVVLKAGLDPHYQAWLGTALAAVEQDGFALPEVIAASDGRWTVQGWGATAFLSGVSSASRDVPWPEVLEAGRAFHRAVRDMSRPEHLEDREDWWAHADRAAWGEQAMDVLPELSGIVDQLRSMPAPRGPAQIVHGDLSGNVLFAPGRPPAIIDISPYWRPAGLAEGIVAADALCWRGAARAELAEYGVSTADAARGLLFRVLTTNAMQQERPDALALAEDARRYERATAELTAVRADADA